MQRSSSTARASDFFLHGAPAVTSSSRTSSDSSDELPLYDPFSEFAKKEKIRMKFAENAVHVIPLVLVICAATLWFFSNPDLDMVNKDIIAGKVEGLTIDGDLEVTHSSTGLLSSLDLGGMNSIKMDDMKPGKFSRT